MVLLDQDSFLTQLTRMLANSRTSGTVYVTFKRCIPGAKTTEKATPEALAKVGCLVRAAGAHQKISCMITPEKRGRFMQSYGNILKVSLDSLKKREKKKSIEKAAPLTRKPTGGKMASA